MLKKIRENRYINKNLRIPLKSVQSDLQDIRERTDILAICPTITNYNWMAINLATKNLFPDGFFEISQYYSKSVYSENELKKIVSNIIKLNFSQVIFNGFPPYFELLINEVTRLNKSIRIGVLFYGYFSEMSGDPIAIRNMNTIIRLKNENKIHKIGLNKKGLAETLKKLTGFSAEYIMIKNPSVNLSINKISVKDEINIGVLGNNSFRKNIHSQVGASLLVDNAKVHVIDASEFYYFGNEERIIEHGFIKDHNKYLEIISAMDINLYISFSESWGLVTTDSLAMGIPCLVSSSGNVFDWDEDLRKKMVVDHYDDSFMIYNRIKQILADKELSSRQLKNYALHLNAIADELLKTFLEQ